MHNEGINGKMNGTRVIRHYYRLRDKIKFANKLEKKNIDKRTAINNERASDGILWKKELVIWRPYYGKNLGGRPN